MKDENFPLQMNPTLLHGIFAKYISEFNVEVCNAVYFQPFYFCLWKKIVERHFFLSSLHELFRNFDWWFWEIMWKNCGELFNEFCAMSTTVINVNCGIEFVVCSFSIWILYNKICMYRYTIQCTANMSITFRFVWMWIYNKQNNKTQAHNNVSRLNYCGQYVVYNC